MGNRLTRIATRTGDDGTTGLANGDRLRKNDRRVEAMGDVDELNSQLGLLLCEPLPDDVRTLLRGIQHELFNLGGELSLPGQALPLLETHVLLRPALPRPHQAEHFGELLARYLFQARRVENHPRAC